MTSNSPFATTFQHINDAQILTAIRAATTEIGRRHASPAVDENLTAINNEVEDLEVLLSALPPVTPAIANTPQASHLEVTTQTGDNR